MQGAEVPAPLQVAVEVVAVRPERPERRVEELAVGGRRARPVRVRFVVSLVRHALGRDLLPALLPRVTIEAENDELVEVCGRFGLYLETRVGLGQLGRGC